MIRGSGHVEVHHRLDGLKLIGVSGYVSGEVLADTRDGIHLTQYQRRELVPVARNVIRHGSTFCPVLRSMASTMPLKTTVLTRL